MKTIFKAKIHSIKSRGSLLVQTTINDDATKVVRRTKELSKLIQSKLGIDETTSGRLVFYLLLEKIALKLGVQLSFKDKSFEQIAHPRQDVRIDVDYIMTYPSLIDLLYENLVDQSYRKTYGQFLTPDYIADFMASWVNIDTPETVLDPAVGTGVFLEKIVQATSLPVELWGFDVDPLMLNACKLRLALQKVENSSVHLEQQDFLEIGIPPKKFDCIICNPPYLKFHNFDRDRLVKNVEVRCGTKLSRLTNIYVLFFMQSVLFAKDGARIAFITPSEFLYTGYGEELKSFLLKYMTLDALVLVDFKALVFNTALTTAVITFFRKGRPSPTHKVKFIRVFKWLTTTEMLDAVISGVESPQNYRIRQISQNELNPREKWLEHFETINYVSIMKKLVPLSQLANVDRGIATGHNDYFVLNKSKVKEWGIEERFLVPIISKTAQCKGYEFTSEDWHRLMKDGGRTSLLYCFDEPTPNLRKYIEHGKRLGVDQRYLTRRRRPWYSMEKKEPAKILATVFHRKRMRFILNNANVRNLTAFHCVYPKFNDTVMIKALLAYLNSDLCKEIQITKRREYGGELHKFEPKDLENIPTLDVTRLTKNDLESLALIFDELCSIFRKGEDETHIRRELDSLLKQIILRM